MSPLCKWTAILMVLLSCAAPAPAKDGTPGATTAAVPAAWRSGWLSVGGNTDIGSVIAGAQDLWFNALVIGAHANRLAGVVRQIQQAGLEAYYWFGPRWPTNRAEHQQVFSDTEQAAFQWLMQDKQMYEHGHQGGGEPLPGRQDFWEGGMPCFHHAGVVEATLAGLREILTVCPDLTGIALDGFGYQNLHDCHCAESERQAQAYAAAHPKLTPGAARERFFLESLAEFQNRIAAEARWLKPGIKITAHVWPAYAPDPVYGKRLDIDYCAQTVAWYFKPYWSDKKIARYTHRVVKEARSIHTRQRGVPFIGYFYGLSEAECKGARRFEHELRVIFGSSPSRSLSIFDFTHVLADPEAVAAMHRVYRDYGVEPRPRP